MPQDWTNRVVQLLAVAAIGLGVAALAQGLGLQSRLDRQAALHHAETTLRAALEQGGRTALQSALNRLVYTADLGFLRLEWREGTRRELLSARREPAAIALLREDWRRAVGDRLLSLGAERGRLEMLAADGNSGRLDWIHRDPVAIGIRDRSLSALRWIGVAAVLIGVALLAALPLAVRAGARQRKQLLQRLQARQQGETAPASTGHAAEDSSSADRGGLRLGLEHLERGLVLVDGERRIRYMNAAAEALCGWPLSEARGRLIYSVFHPLDDQDQPLPTPAERVLEGGATISGEEIRLRSRDASVRPIEVDAASGGSGTDRYAVMLFRDISTRRLRQREQQKQLDQGQQLLDSLPEGVIVTEPDGTVRRLNAEALRMFGYSAAELIGDHAKRVLPVPFMNSPEVRFLDYLGSVPAGRRPRVVGWRKDGASFPVELVVHGIDGDPSSGLVLVIRDDSARRNAERAMQRIGRILDRGGLEVLVLDAATRQIVELNTPAREALGYAAAELRGLSYDRIADADGSGALDTLFDRLRRASEAPQTVQLTHRRADGSRYALSATFQFAAEEEPPMVMVIGLRVATGPRAVAPQPSSGSR